MPDFLFLKTKKIKYLDALTYVSIRYHNNNDREYAHPSYERIAEVSGLGRTFVVDSVKRLELAGFLTITHSKRQGRCNRYHFGKLDHFERIPPALLKVTDLSPNEKAMLICLRQFLNHGLHSSADKVSDFARHLGVGYRAVDRQFKGLLAKGYVEEVAHRDRKGFVYRQSYHLTGLIDWHYVYSNLVQIKPSPCLLMVG